MWLYYAMIKSHNFWTSRPRFSRFKYLPSRHKDFFFARSMRTEHSDNMVTLIIPNEVYQERQTRFMDNSSRRFKINDKVSSKEFEQDSYAGIT